MILGSLCHIPLVILWIQFQQKSENEELARNRIQMFHPLTKGMVLRKEIVIRLGKTNAL